MNRAEVVEDVELAIENRYLNKFGNELRADKRWRLELPYLMEVSKRAILGDSHEVKPNGAGGGEAASSS